jgi:hypothetical protein
MLIEHAAREAVIKELDSEMSDKRYINLERVPLICQSIVRIDKSVADIQSNITWAVRLVLGAVIMALIGLVVTQV